MLLRIVICIAALAGIIAMPAAADQSDSRLDALFRLLRAAPDAAISHPIEARVWQIWTESKMVGTRIVLREGLAAMQENDYEKALARFDAVVELEPEFAEGWNKRATVLFLMGDYAGSVKDIERTLSLESRHFGALSGLGMIYDSLDQKEPALKAFRAALEIHPNLEGIKSRVRELAKNVEGREL